MNRQSIKISVLLTSLFIMLLSFSSVQAQQKAHYNTYVSSNCNGFYDFLPSGYDPSGTKLYPLIIFVHGSWEYGSGSTSTLPKVLKHGPPHVIANGQWPSSFTLNSTSYKFIVFSPQFRSSAGASSINDIINYVVNHYKVDKSRIYITGLSSGGGTVEAAAADATVGKRIAAVVSFAGTNAPSVTKAANIITNKVGFWGVHNKGDDVVPYTKTTTWVSDILSVSSSAPVRKTIPSATGHNCWTSRYVPTWTQDGLSIYQWMLQYKKGTTTTTSNKAPVANAGGDKTIFLPTNKLALSGSGKDGDGSISKYSWTKYSGPSSYTFSSTTSATPTVSNLVAGTYVFRLKVTDNDGATDYDDVNVVVKSPISVPGKVEAESYSSMSGVTKESCSEGGYSLGAIDQSDWMSYSVKASSSGTYTLTFRLASNATGGQFQVKNSSGTVLATVNVPNTGGYQTWKSVTAKVSLPSGTQVLKLYSTNSTHWNINYVSFATGTTTSTTTTATKIEAENYSAMSGVAKEATTDAGGGQNLAAIDQGDWTKYSNISINTSGTYTFTFRLASATLGAKFDVFDTYNSVKTLVKSITVPKTGGWQTWTNVTASITLKAGTHTFVLYSSATPHWNLNYFKYALASGTTTSTELDANAATETVSEEGTTTSALTVAPNPFSDRFVLKVNNPYTGTMKVQLISASGVVSKEFQVTKNATGTMQTYLSAGTLTKGTYFIKVTLGEWTQTSQIVKL